MGLFGPMIDDLLDVAIGNNGPHGFGPAVTTRIPVYAPAHPIDTVGNAYAAQVRATSLMRQEPMASYEFAFFLSTGMTYQQAADRVAYLRAERDAGGREAYSRQLDERIAKAKGRLTSVV